MSVQIPGLGKAAAPSNPFNAVGKLWRLSKPIRVVLSWAFILYGWQQLWRNGQANEDPFIAYALTEWWHTGRDFVASVWDFLDGADS